LTTLGVKTAYCPLDWLIPVLAGLPEQQVAWPGRGDVSSLFRVHTYDAPAMANWAIKAKREEENVPVLEAVAELHELPDNEPRGSDIERAGLVLDRVHFDYPHLAAASVRAVMAASEVKRVYDILRDPDEQPRGDRTWRPGADGWTVASDRESARLRGTATHKVLQHLDFGAGDEPAVRIELNRMRDAGMLTAEEAGRADVDAISWFVGTPLGRAIREAGVAYRREFMFLAGHSARLFDETLGPEVDERVLVRGIVDGILPRGDGVEVIEFKTDRIEKKGVPEATDGYRPQVRLYATSVEPIFRRPVMRCWLVFLHPREIVEIGVSP
jgi:ATP-dependent helicase/nuclease subunit A